MAFVAAGRSGKGREPYRRSSEVEHFQWVLQPRPEFGGRRDFAVVGTGIAGMSAAWLMAKRHDITVYEREQWVGGHSHTVDVRTEHGPVAVDTGFIVYNEANYPNLTALFHHLGVPTKLSCMQFSVSLDDRARSNMREIFRALIGTAGSV